MRPSGRKALAGVLLCCVALALALGLLVSRLWHHKSPRLATDRRPAAAPGAPKPPGFEFQSTRLKVMDPRTGRTVWEISLAKAETASNTGETWLSEISAVYHNPDGTTSRLTSGQAHLAPDGKVLEFSGQVRLSATNGGALSAGTLRWESGKERFVAQAAAGGQVSFQRGGTTLRAPEFQGDMTLKKVRATGGAQLTGGE